MTEPDRPVLRIVRRLAASPDEVFDAWLDADGIREWMCPASGTVPVAEVDARVGGRFRIVMKGERGEIEHTGIYREIQRPVRPAFTWISAHTHGLETLVTIVLRPVGGDTELTLTHEHLPDDESRKRHEGWRSILERLAEKLGRR